MTTRAKSETPTTRDAGGRFGRGPKGRPPRGIDKPDKAPGRTPEEAEHGAPVPRSRSFAAPAVVQPALVQPAQRFTGAFPADPLFAAQPPRYIPAAVFSAPPPVDVTPAVPPAVTLGASPKVRAR